jgi:hypothetical protein
MRNPQYLAQMQQMMQQRMQNQAQQDAYTRMQQQFAPMQNYQGLMQSAPMSAPQFQGYQGLSPMALAQMLRQGGGGAIPQAPDAGVGINPMARPFNVGINPMAGRGFGVTPMQNRSAYLDFLNSMSGG